MIGIFPLEKVIHHISNFKCPLILFLPGTGSETLKAHNQMYKNEERTILKMH